MIFQISLQERGGSSEHFYEGGEDRAHPFKSDRIGHLSLFTSVLNFGFSHDHTVFLGSLQAAGPVCSGSMGIAKIIKIKE